MKQAGYSKRPYSRSPERQRHTHTKQPNGPSPEGKMRGNPQQFVEKYLTLARDAASLGDPISAENYYQFADHYYRLVTASRTSRPAPSEKKTEIRETPVHPDPLPQQDQKWLE
jgi:hypothetical protein